MLSEIALSMPIGGWHPLLPAVLRSVVAQKPRVNVAVLDASGDRRVADALDASELEFQYRRVGPDAGQSAAIAEGWCNVQGDVLAWLNVDDLLTPNALELALQHLDNSDDVDVVYGDSVIIGIDGSVLGVHGQVGNVDDGIAIINCISQPSCFFRRAAVEKVGGLNETLGFSMDWELWIRMQRAGLQFRRVAEHLSAVYWGVGTKTSELSIARLMELFSHTQRYDGPINAARMLLGVVTQSVTSAPGVTKVIGDIARRKAVGGLLMCADRNPREQAVEQAVIPLINPFDAGQSDCFVQFEGGQCSVEVVPGGRVVAERVGLLQIKLNNPIPPGQVVHVTLTGSNEPSRLLRVAWGAAPSAGSASEQRK